MVYVKYIKSTKILCLNLITIFLFLFLFFFPGPPDAILQGGFYQKQTYKKCCPNLKKKRRKKH